MGFTSDFILRGTRADQPTPPASPFAVALYCVTDEGNKIERWNGTIWESYSPTGLGTVTTTGSPAAGELTQFSGADSITNGDLSGDVTTAGSLATTIANDAVSTAKIADNAVSNAKLDDMAANTVKARAASSTGDPSDVALSASELLGRGSSGDIAPIVMGSGVTISGTTLSATGSGGTVTTTGSPASGNLAKFSGATSITNADLTGDVTTAGGVAATIANDAVTFAKMQNIATDSLIGRDTASTGDPESITLDTTLEFSGSQTIRRAALTGDVTASAGSNATTLASNLKLATIELIIDGGGSTITTGVKADLEIPFACTINQVTLLADQSGSIVVDIWKDTYANYPPTGADSITASAKPTISSATKSQDSTLTGWTTSISAGDTLRFNVDSVTTITRVALSLKVTKT